MEEGGMSQELFFGSLGDWVGGHPGFCITATFNKNS